MKKVAILTPYPCADNDFAFAKSLANQIVRKTSDDIFIIFSYGLGEENRVSDLDGARIHKREISWEMIKGKTLEQYSVPFMLKQLTSELSSDCYCYPRDGANDLCDCDLWVLIGENFSAQIYPIKKQFRIASIDQQTPDQLLELSQEVIGVIEETDFL